MNIARVGVIASLIALLAFPVGVGAGKKTAMSLYKEATQALNSGDNKAAVSLYDESLADGNLTVDYLSYAYYNRGMAKYRLGDFDGAKRDLTKARELNINDVVPDYGLGVTGTPRHK